MKQATIDDAWKDDLPRINSIIHSMQKNDKNVFDKATRALVSHVKAYSKHECNLILRTKDLDLGRVATSYGLLRLPKMPEMREEFNKSFIGPENTIDINSLKYKNKQKQVAYQAKQEIFQQTGEWPGKKLIKKKTESFDEAKKTKEFRKENRKKRQELKKTLKESGGVINKKRKMKFSQDELDELARDNAAFKKFRKHKIGKNELDSQIGIDSDDLSD